MRSTCRCAGCETHDTSEQKSYARVMRLLRELMGKDLTLSEAADLTMSLVKFEREDAIRGTMSLIFELADKEEKVSGEKPAKGRAPRKVKKRKVKA